MTGYLAAQLLIEEMDVEIRHVFSNYSSVKSYIYRPYLATMILMGCHLA
jgi:hypothetical protein